MLYTKTNVESLDVVSDILSGEIKLQDLDFHCHLLRRGYIPKLNFFKSWDAAERFEVHAENYSPKIIKFFAKIKNGKVVFETPDIVWRDVTLTAKHAVICYEEKIFLTLSFSKSVSTIKGNFTIDTSSGIFKISMEN